MARLGSAAPTRTGRLLVALLVGVVGVVAAVGAPEIPLLRRLELATLDWRFHWRGEIEPSGDVALVVIDDASVVLLGRWPVPRDAVAEALQKLTAAGARVIALDLLLADPQTALDKDVRAVLEAARAAVGPSTPGLRSEIDGILARSDGDLALAAAISEAGNVVTPYAFVPERRDANIRDLPRWVQATAYRAWTSGPGEGVSVSPVEGLLVPAPALAGTSASTGHVSLEVDVDGSVRADLPAYPFLGQLLPSLPIETVRLFEGLPPEALLAHLGRRIVIGDRSVPVDEATRLLVNHYGPAGTIPTFGFADLLDSKVPEAALRDRIVVVGATATGAGDRFATPYTTRLPGAEHLATAIDNILTGRALVRDARVRGADAVVTLTLALLAAFLVGRRTYARSLVATALLLIGWTAVAFTAFATSNLWLGMVAPLGGILVASGAAEGMRITAEQRARRRVEHQRANLARYFAPSVVDRLATTPEPISFGRLEGAAVMFVDLVAFTRISEAVGAAAALELLRGFHGRVERAVFAYGGMVDKFVGDGAMACFGVPEPSPSCCADALRAARALVTALEVWGDELEAQGRPRLRAGIGIDHGPLIMGNIGGARQFQFTVIGDAANTASRLETLTRSLDAAVVVSDEVVRRARKIDPETVDGLVPLDPMPVRGRTQPIRVWTLPRAVVAAQ